MIDCRFSAGNSWNPLLKEIIEKKGIPFSMESELVDLILEDREAKKIIFVEFKDSDLHSSLYGGKVSLRWEFGRMIAKATHYKLQGYLVECYCIYMQPKLVMEDLIQFLNDERTLLSICADYGIKGKPYGNKPHAAEFPFKRITERWGIDLSIPLKDGKTDVPLLDKWLSDIPGVSPEKAQLWAGLFDHNLGAFMDCWVNMSGTFCYNMEAIYPKNQDGTPSAQYAFLYQLFFD